MNPRNDEALEVSCSACKALAGVPCDMPTRSPAAAHIIRRDLAEQYRRVRAHDARNGAQRHTQPRTRPR